MTDLPTRNRSPGRGCGGSQGHDEVEAAERLQADYIRNRRMVATEDYLATLSRALDAFIAAAIEIKDALDGDPDLEPYLAGADSDLEAEDEHDEPSLGWTTSGSLGYDPTGSDREEEHP